MKKIVSLLATLFISSFHSTLTACEQRPDTTRVINDISFLFKIQSHEELLSLIKSDSPLSLSDWGRIIDELIEQVSSTSTIESLHKLYAQEYQLQVRLIPASDMMDELEQFFYHAAIELRHQRFAQAYAKRAHAITEEQELLDQKPQRTKQDQQEQAIKPTHSTTTEVPQRIPLSQAQLAALCHKK